MFCKSCGSEITSDQLFCPHCGTKNEQVTPSPIPSQVPPSMIPSQVSPSPIPNQVSPNQNFNQAPPIPPVPPNQMPPNQGSPGQIPPYSSPNHVPPMPPLPPNQGHSGSYNAGPNQAPPLPPLPPLPPYAYDSGKKKNKALIPIVIGVAALFLIIAIVIVVKVIGFVKDVQDTVSEEVTDIYTDDTYTDPYAEDTSDLIEDITEDIIPEESTDTTSDDVVDGSDYNLAYTYVELPDVVSVDSDSRFTYYDYYYDSEFVTYTFQFNDTTVSDSDFYTAVDDYCSLLMSWNGYYYEEDFSYDQYSTTGEYTDYFSKDDIAISVTGSVEDAGRFAYVSIYDLADVPKEDTTDYSYPNYYYYIDGRDTQYFEFDSEVQMENGVAFYLYSADIYDNGDGTSEVICNMDLASVYEETYLYTDSFVAVPMDADGNFLGDASLIEYVTDSEGNSVSEPYLLDTEYYYNYNVSFIVPEGTTAVSIYGTNMFNGTSSGPIYYFDMEIIEE